VHCRRSIKEKRCQPAHGTRTPVPLEWTRVRLGSITRPSSATMTLSMIVSTGKRRPCVPLRFTPMLTESGWIRRILEVGNHLCFANMFRGSDGIISAVCWSGTHLVETSRTDRASKLMLRIEYTAVNTLQGVSGVISNKNCGSSFKNRKKAGTARMMHCAPTQAQRFAESVGFMKGMSDITASADLLKTPWAGGTLVLHALHQTCM
jgi:hypothetical protein